MYRFVFNAKFPSRNNKTFFGDECETREEAVAQLNLVANYTLYLHDSEIMADYSNYGEIHQFVDGSWRESEEPDLASAF